MAVRNNIISISELDALVTSLRRGGKTIVTTNGAFDMLHIGHLRALKKSKTFGDVLIVGVNSDLSVKDYKSPDRPIIPEDERAELVAALACVDYVVIFNERDPLRFLGIVKPDVHTKGGDYDPEKLLETVLIRENGGRIEKTDTIKSTTGIIGRILEIYGKVLAEQPQPEKENGRGPESE